MPKIVPPLRDSKVAAARPRDRDYRLADGGGLYLLVTRLGSKLWRLRYRKPCGGESLAALGAYPAVSLADARRARDDFVRALAAGVDPVAERRRPSGPTFLDAAREWHGAQQKWTPDHAARVWRRFELLVLPALGGLPLAAIEAPQVVAVLDAIASRGTHDVASRVRQYITAVFRRAVQRGVIKHSPAECLAGVATSAKSQHRPALPLAELPELLQRVRAYPHRPVTRLCVLLLLHTFVRSSELRMARFAEFDLAAGLWVVPGKREPLPGCKFGARGAKMGSDHIVPLSPQACALVAELRELTGPTELLLPGDHRDDAPVSEGTVNKALARMGYCTKTQVCGHGFRAMACSALVESGQFSRDAIERQMSHQERSGVRAAYVHKAEFLAEREKIMRWWSGYLEALETGGYVPPWEFRL